MKFTLSGETRRNDWGAPSWRASFSLEEIRRCQTSSVDAFVSTPHAPHLIASASSYRLFVPAEATELSRYLAVLDQLLVRQLAKL
jgi:hypothetical protein